MLKDEQLTKYRSSHVIRPVANGMTFCETDLVRILPRKGGLWRHDPDQIKRLVSEVGLSARLAARVGTR